MQKTPDDLRPAYEQWLKIWESKKFYIYWGTVGFSLRVMVQGKLQTVVEAYPEWAVSLIREVDAEKCGASPELHQKYLSDIDPVPKAVSYLALAPVSYLWNEHYANNTTATCFFNEKWRALDISYKIQAASTG